MSPYFISIETAAWSFPLIAFVAALPYAVYNYRRYGSVSLWRTVVLFSFAFYLQCAYYLVILPLPDPAEVAGYTTPQFDWMPFRFIFDLGETTFSITDPSTWLPVLKSMVVLEPLFNVLLTLPFGVYLAYYFEKDWKKCLLLSFFLSFFFEMTQLSGLYGIYPRPYRLFSTDDLMLNSLGGMIGYFAYSHLLRFLPQKEKLDQKSNQRSITVGFPRRIAAMLVDGFIIGIIKNQVTSVYKIDGNPVYLTALLTTIYAIAFTLLTRGRTPGKALVRIKLVTCGEEQAFPLSVALRWLLRNTLLFAFSLLNMLVGRNDDWQLLWLALFVLLVLLSAADMVYSTRKNRRLWYERLSQTENISTFKVKT